MKRYDLLIIGHISRDIMVFHDGTEERCIGGAVVYASAAAARSAGTVLALTKAARADRAALDAVAERAADWRILDSPRSTSIRNEYFSEDRERRRVTLISRADSFTVQEALRFSAQITYCAGLAAGEIPDPLIEAAAQRSEVALDAQGVLRSKKEESNELVFADWQDKHRLLPLVTYFKVDAVEAEILTGSDDREQAAVTLRGWGAREVVLTHGSEVLVCTAGNLYRAPYTNRNNKGRTGRGDTTFAAYLAWRKAHPPAQAVVYAAALCSIKMEAPGPYTGTVQDVFERIGRDYSYPQSEGGGQ